MNVCNWYIIPVFIQSHIKVTALLEYLDLYAGLTSIAIIAKENACQVAYTWYHSRE